jgi:hypothetical protein
MHARHGIKPGKGEISKIHLVFFLSVLENQLRIFRLAFSNWKMIPHADTITDLLITAQLAAPLYFSNGVESKVFWMFTPAIRALQDPDQNRFSGSYRLSRLKIDSSLASAWLKVKADWVREQLPGRAKQPEPYGALQRFSAMRRWKMPFTVGVRRARL